jgi:hypothetical protein
LLNRAVQYRRRSVFLAQSSLANIGKFFLQINWIRIKKAQVCVCDVNPQKKQDNIGAPEILAKQLKRT